MVKKISVLLFFIGTPQAKTVYENQSDYKKIVSQKEDVEGHLSKSIIQDTLFSTFTHHTDDGKLKTSWKHVMVDVSSFSSFGIKFKNRTFVNVIFEAINFNHGACENAIFLRCTFNKLFKFTSGILTDIKVSQSTFNGTAETQVAFNNNVFMKGMTFSDTVCQYVNFDSAKFTGDIEWIDVKFDHCNLSNALFTHTLVLNEGTTFQDCDFTLADFRSTAIQGKLDLRTCNVDRVKIYDYQLVHFDLPENHTADIHKYHKTFEEESDYLKDALQTSELQGIVFENINLSNTTLVDVDFSNALIEKANFSFSDLSLSTFNDVQFPDDVCNYTALINLKKTNMTHAQPTPSKKGKQVLTPAQIEYCKYLLRNRDFSGRTFSHISFAGAHLKNANFSHAHIQGHFKNVDLHDSIFTGAKIARDICPTQGSSVERTLNGFRKK